jgi:hypothetical protein
MIVPMQKAIAMGYRAIRLILSKRRLGRSEAEVSRQA